MFLILWGLAWDVVRMAVTTMALLHIVGAQVDERTTSIFVGPTTPFTAATERPMQMVHPVAHDAVTMAVTTMVRVHTVSAVVAVKPIQSTRAFVLVITECTAVQPRM